jgi:hypothetical protein
MAETRLDLDPGYAYLLFGGSSDWSPDGDLWNADYRFVGEVDIDWAGWTVSSAGDVNGAGLDDLLGLGYLPANEF